MLHPKQGHIRVQCPDIEGRVLHEVADALYHPLPDELGRCPRDERLRADPHAACPGEKVLVAGVIKLRSKGTHRQVPWAEAWGADDEGREVGGPVHRCKQGLASE